MNILLLGNGFDLAHGLPTKYVDFLEWVKAEYGLYTELREQGKEIIDKLDPVRVNWAILSYPSKMQGKVTILAEKAKQIEIWQSIDNNIWIDYFLNNPMYQRENWIDFESEIGRIIRSIDSDMEGEDFDGQIRELTNEYLSSRYLHNGMKKNGFGEWPGICKITYRELRDALLKDLSRLIRSLEIYLYSFVPGKMVKIVGAIRSCL